MPQPDRSAHTAPPAASDTRPTAPPAESIRARTAAAAFGPRAHACFVAAALLVAALLAVLSLRTDSATFDEPFHLAAGYAALTQSDYRLSPDHPPLGRIWAALPLLFVDAHWPSPDDPHWVAADCNALAIRWLFGHENRHHFIVLGRGMMVALLLATLAATYATARQLYGSAAALLALALAALDPTLLAHGRLVTTDLPLTLANALVLLTVARLLEHVSWPRLIAAALAVAALPTTKMSWPVVLPALALMAAAAVLRRAPLQVAGRPPSAGPAPAGPRLLVRPAERVPTVFALVGVLGLAAWGGIWAAYQGQSTILPSPPPGPVPTELQERMNRTQSRLEQDWQIALLDTATGRPRTDLLTRGLVAAAEYHLLPDAYIFGLARVRFLTGQRYAYLCGEYSTTGWASYFPIAFLIKTPVATLVLLAAGLAGLLLRRVTVRSPVLLIGLLGFVAAHGASSVTANLNIGHRHLLPLYPVVCVLAGGAVAWFGRRGPRLAVAGLLIWLAGANLTTFPHYLAYFNELVGGRTRGHLYLADSNLDWGQDLLRLAAWARAHPDEPLKLAYFGSAPPPAYVSCRSLPSHFDWQPRAALDAGTYVVSATQLLGVYDPEIRRDYWTARNRAAYAELGRIAASVPEPGEPPDKTRLRAQAAAEFAEMRYKRLLSRLADRPPDERVGAALFVYRLSARDVAELTRP